ncbi:hypothetical protein C8R46DRAFT_1229872 [Mycena filopes]|nr:hypothetical protein C8R46DRAFT_1229872 [Mycena filopes]
MLIKLTPAPSSTPTPTILFAISFPDLPGSLPVPAAWAAQLARLVADDLEAPPALHALDRAAALPALLAEVQFDLPQGRIACSFLDGATEEWSLEDGCREMLARVICDVEESGRAEERAREWTRKIEAERERLAREEREKEEEREAELERAYEEKNQSLRSKGKAKEQSLNSPPTSLKGTTRPKNRLHKSRSLLMALVATFSSPSPPPAPASAPPTRTSYSSPPRSPSPLRAFRRASFTSLRAESNSSSKTPSSSSSSATSAPHSPAPTRPIPPTPKRTRSASSTSPASSPPTSPTPAPAPFNQPSQQQTPALHNLETPPGSAPPSAPSSAFSQQQRAHVRARPSREELSPRALRRRARSTLVDAFRLHVVPELGRRVALFEGPVRCDQGPPEFELDVEWERDDGVSAARAPGGGYPAWVARSMLRRAEARMRELEGTWPALAGLPTQSESPRADDAQGPFSPVSASFPSSPSRVATFEPWSSGSESESETDTDGTESESGGALSDVGDEGEEELEGYERVEDEDDSDGSSVHTPESGHSIGYGLPKTPSPSTPPRRQGHGHGQDASASTTSSYFTCTDEDEEQEQEAQRPGGGSHIRAPAHSGLDSQPHSRQVSGSGAGRAAHRRGTTSDREVKRAQRERRRAEHAAKAEHTAFGCMTARLRRVLAQGAAARGLGRAQRAEAERLREGRGVRRAWLGRRGGPATVQQARVFKASDLGRWAWDAADAEREAEEERLLGELEGEEGREAGKDMPPAYEDVVAETPVPHALRRMRPAPPMHRAAALAHLDGLELDVADDLEVLEAVGALDGLDIDVDLEHLDLSDALDIDGMALAVDGDLEYEGELGFGHGGGDVFADAGSKGKGARGRRVPVPHLGGKGKVKGTGRRRDVPVWERRLQPVGV